MWTEGVQGFDPLPNSYEQPSSLITSGKAMMAAMGGGISAGTLPRSFPTLPLWYTPEDRNHRGPRRSESTEILDVLDVLDTEILNTPQVNLQIPNLC